MAPHSNTEMNELTAHQAQLLAQLKNLPVLTTPSLKLATLNMELTPHQTTALARMKATPVPPTPALKPETLVSPPAWYTLIPLSSLAVTALFLCLLTTPFIKLPQTWQGLTPLKSGSILELITPGRQTIALPNRQGFLTLQGPAILEFHNLGKTLLTGRTEADLTLNFGRLHMAVNPATPKLIHLNTPLLATRITGTQLFLTHHPKTGSHLLVLEGTVEAKGLKYGSDWKSIQAGMELRVSPKGAVVISPVLPSHQDGVRADRTPRANGAPMTGFQLYLWFEEKVR